MNKIIKNWLEKLAKANEESFGSGRLDCCELNGNSNNFTNVNAIKTTNNQELKNKGN